jgi:hypothetical protein
VLPRVPYGTASQFFGSSSDFVPNYSPERLGNCVNEILGHNIAVILTAPIPLRRNTKASVKFRPGHA